MGHIRHLHPSQTAAVRGHKFARSPAVRTATAARPAGRFYCSSQWQSIGGDSTSTSSSITGSTSSIASTSMGVLDMTLAHLAPKEGDANSGAASGQRARNKFADRTQANYDTETTAGIAYRGIEFYEFEEKITDIAPTPDWTDDRRVIVCDRVRECALRGAAIIGAFAVQPSGHQVLVGAVVLDGRPIGRGLDSLDILFLSVGTSIRERYLTGDNPGTAMNPSSIGVEQVLFDKISAEAKGPAVLAPPSATQFMAVLVLGIMLPSRLQA